MSKREEDAVNNLSFAILVTGGLVILTTGIAWMIFVK